MKTSGKMSKVRSVCATGLGGVSLKTFRLLSNDLLKSSLLHFEFNPLNTH